MQVPSTNSDQMGRVGLLFSARVAFATTSQIPSTYHSTRLAFSKGFQRSQQKFSVSRNLRCAMAPTAPTDHKAVTRIGDSERFSMGVIHNGVFQSAGLLSSPSSGSDISSQTRDIFSQIDNLLSEAGTSKSELLTVTIWLADVKDITAFNEQWDAWLDKSNKPVRACVQSALVRADALVEIQVTAAVPTSSRIVSTSDAAAAVGPYSQGIISDNGTVYVSGCIGLTADSGVMAGNSIHAQTVQALSNLRAILKEAGCTPKDIVKTTILLDDMGAFSEVNQLYEAFFDGGRVPARSCFAAKQLPKGALVEIEAIATVPIGQP